jgi:type I restriction enzyme, R subunit
MINYQFSESVVEKAALAWFESLGYRSLFAAFMAPGEPETERDDYSQLILTERLRQALTRLNPALPSDAIEEAFRKLSRPDSPSLVLVNHDVHRLLVDGVNVEFQREGRIVGAQVRVLDFDDPANNDWLVVNQFTIIENRHNRRPDIVVFVNGLPLAVLELKNAADEKTDIWQAFNQLQTYKAEIPALFHYNAALVISDGIYARLGTLTADRERFLPWRTIGGEAVADRSLSELQVIIEGVFDPRRFLDLIRYFIVFEDEGGGKLTKKIAGYHQFHAVNVAVEETLRAVRSQRALREREGVYMADRSRDAKIGDRRIGVVWHTQGSGKSLTMAFYAGRIILHPAMENPTLVILTDRNDLDDQLFGTFARCKELLRQPPVQAQDRDDLHEKLRVNAGGVVFTTLQKFFPETQGGLFPMLSDRQNIVVIADEAHRSQYGLNARWVEKQDSAYFTYGFAKHIRDALPNASFIGFTGTPVELEDVNTRAIFGEYISIYDIQRAVQDGATVPIFYESRLVKLEIRDSERPKVDSEFDEATEGEELEHKEQLKTKWAQLEKIVGAKERIAIIAQDIVTHFEQRQSVMNGKAMIVGMSRRICVDLYNAIIKLRPEWHSTDDEQGWLKIIMTGSASDDLDWQPHIRNKARREVLANRFKDAGDPFKIVIVRDMWLTGFDAPSLHTMYIDKPMHGHGLMQAIARVNRVFRDKPGGLIVDYLGLADQLREALGLYTLSGGSGETAIAQREAVVMMQTKYEVCRDFFHSFNWSKWTTGSPQERLSVLPMAQEHVLSMLDGKARFMQAVRDLSIAFALAMPHESALAIRDDVGFFQAVRAALSKSEPGDGEGQNHTNEDLNHAIRQIISGAITSGAVIDVFAAAGLKKPDISILSDAFLAEVSKMPQRNLAVELLRKLLTDEIRRRGRKNVVQARSFSEMLEAAIRRYQNRAIETAQIIEELIKLAKDIRHADTRGEALGLTEDEIAFYDALEVNDSAVKVLGDDTLQAIARDLVRAVKGNVTIDWTVRENVRAQMRVIVKRILRKYGYPPNKQEKATQTVLEQAETLAQEWADA